MGNDDNGVSLFLHAAQHAEELVDLLHRQHGSGLVQNDDLGTVVQNLDDLQGLLLRDGHVVDLLLGIDLKTEFLGHVLDLCVAVFLQEQTGFFLTHPDVVGGGEYIHQLEVLVNHADSQPFGILRGINGNLFAVHEDLTLVRLIDTGEHIHQGGLTGAVLTQQGEDLTGTDVQLHIVVGNHAAEGLGNALQLNGILCAHGVSFLLSC